ncbi:MAG: conjugal transfer protein TraF, partial [Rhodothermales bacterium]
LGTLDASAQSYSQTARAFVQSPQALGMGDTGVAFTSRENVFFYNPAHLAHVAGLRPRISILGIRGSLSDNLFDQIAFYQDELEPAIDEGIDNLSNERQEELYDEAIALGRKRTFLNGDLLLPSVMMRVGDVGIGAGIFGHSMLRYRFEDAGAGVPLIDMNAIADLIIVGSAAADLSNYGVDGLTAGITGKIAQRWLTSKNKALDELSEDEDVYLLKGSSIGFDIGLLYDIDFVPLPGDLKLGFTAYDIIASDFDYKFNSNLTENSADNQAVISEEEDYANETFGLSPSFRIGAAYMFPGLSTLGILKNTGITLDYLWYSDPLIKQESLANLHVGAQAQLAFFVARAGLSQGYTTLGAGLHLGFMKIDYAFYGVEQGRYPGQLPGWNHTAQIAFGL